MKTITYKGYQASVEFDNGSLYVKVLHIDDVLIAECDKASDAEAAAQELIDDYLQDCKEEGRDPAKPFKGSFNVRIAPDLHRRAAVEAAEASVSLNTWVGLAIQEKIECSRLSERIDGVISSGKRNMTLHFTDVAAFWAEKGAQGSMQVNRQKRLMWEEAEPVAENNVVVMLHNFGARRGHNG